MAAEMIHIETFFFTSTPVYTVTRQYQ